MGNLFKCIRKDNSNKRAEWEVTQHINTINNLHMYDPSKSSNYISTHAIEFDYIPTNTPDPDVTIVYSE
jgi:hypothetical protein